MVLRLPLLNSQSLTVEEVLKVLERGGKVKKHLTKPLAFLQYPDEKQGEWVTGMTVKLPNPIYHDLKKKKAMRQVQVTEIYRIWEAVPKEGKIATN